MYKKLLDGLEAGATVVTGNNRLARTLRHAYDQRQLQRGLSVWATPDVQSWSEWQRSLWEESRLHNGIAAERVLLSENAAALLWQAVIAADKQAPDHLNIASLARHARSSWQTLNDWNALSAGEWASAAVSSDQKAWLRWSGRYRDQCAEHNRVDSEQLCGLLTEDVRNTVFTPPGPLLFCGFDTWVPARRELLAALQAAGVRLDIVSDRTSEHAREFSLRLCPCPDQHAELKAAATWARQCLEQQPEAVVGVVVPDLANRAADVKRVFLDVLVTDWRVSDQPVVAPLNVSYGESLAGVPVIAAALNVLALGQGRAVFNDFSLWLRSRWFAGAQSEAAERSWLDLRLREALRIEFPLHAALPLCRQFAPQFAVLLSALVQHADARNRQSGPEWAQAFSGVLEALGWPGDSTVNSAVWQALQAWQKLLRDFADSTALLGDLSRAEALGVLRQLAQARLFQPEGAADGVQVMGVLEAAGHRFDHLWICGMARECWPVAARPDPFIPLVLQRRLGLPDASATDTLEHARLQAARLQASAPDLTVSWPAAQDGEALSLSPLFAATAEPRPLVLAPDWNSQMRAAGVTEVLAIDPPPAWTRNTAVPGGAGVLNLQAISPINAFMEKRLGALEMRRPAVGINALQRGNLTHKALEDFYKASPGHAEVAALSLSERAERLRVSLERELSRLPGANDGFMKRLARFELQQQQQRILSFIEQDMQRPPFYVVECERQHTVTIGPICLRLKLDRLDEVPGAGYLVIDYKTGQVRRQSWNPDKPRDMQLPLYVSCVVPDAVGVAFAQVSSRGIGYDGVGSADLTFAGMRVPGAKKRTEVKFLYPKSQEVITSWEALRQVWSDLLTSLAENFAAGDFRLDPRNPDSGRGQFAVLSRVYDWGADAWEEGA